MQDTGTGIDAALVALLAAPGVAAGSRLPTERALADRFGVSRSTVRAALSRLEARGDVVRRVGSGTYAARPLAAPTGDVSPREIMDTRLAVEPALAALIVAHADRADIDRICAAMLAARAAPDADSFEVCDAAFHDALALATRNRLMIAVSQTIGAARALAEWGELKRRHASAARRAGYDAEHAAIAEALLARDAPRAEAAIRAHLLTVRRELLGL